MSDNKHSNYRSRRDVRKNNKKPEFFSKPSFKFLSFLDLKNSKSVFLVTFSGIFFVTLVSLGGFMVVVNPANSSNIVYTASKDSVFEVSPDNQLLYSRSGVEVIDPDRKLGSLLALSTNIENITKNSEAISGLLSMPLKNVSVESISSPFGSRDNPTSPGSEEHHTGIDYAVDPGTPIFAAASGVVHSISRSSSGYGNRIVIEHTFDDAEGYSNTGLTLRTAYSHMSAFPTELLHVDKITGKTMKTSLVEGARVDRGGLIGFVGTTGNSTGNHLHFEVEIVDKNGKSSGYIDPLPWLRAK